LLSRSEKTYKSESQISVTDKTDKTYPVAPETNRSAIVEAAARSRPEDVSDAHWETALLGLRAFLDAGWGDKAEAAGWRHDELYRVPPVWARVDLCGAGLLIGDRTVTEVTSETIALVTASGAVQRFCRKPEPDFGLVYETHLKLIRGNYSGDSEEPRLRALEHTVRFCCDHAGLNLEDAKKIVTVAIERSSSSSGVPAR
jgi:hypothetical protein